MDATPAPTPSVDLNHAEYERGYRDGVRAGRCVAESHVSSNDTARAALADAVKRGEANGTPLIALTMDEARALLASTEAQPSQAAIWQANSEETLHALSLLLLDIEVGARNRQILDTHPARRRAEAQPPTEPTDAWAEQEVYGEPPTEPTDAEFYAAIATVTASGSIVITADTLRNAEPDALLASVRRIVDRRAAAHRTQEGRP